jgi:hypothetical protein
VARGRGSSKERILAHALLDFDGVSLGARLGACDNRGDLGEDVSDISHCPHDVMRALNQRC